MVGDALTVRNQNLFPFMSSIFIYLHVYFLCKAKSTTQDIWKYFKSSISVPAIEETHDIRNDTLTSYQHITTTWFLIPISCRL